MAEFSSVVKRGSVPATGSCGPGTTGVAARSGGEGGAVTVGPGGGVLTVPEAPAGMERGGPGCFGGSLKFARGRLRTEERLPRRERCALRECRLAGRRSRPGGLGPGWRPRGGAAGWSRSGGPSVVRTGKVTRPRPPPKVRRPPHEGQRPPRKVQRRDSQRNRGKNRLNTLPISPVVRQSNSRQEHETRTASPSFSVSLEL